MKPKTSIQDAFEFFASIVQSELSTIGFIDESGSDVPMTLVLRRNENRVVLHYSEDDETMLFGHAVGCTVEVPAVIDGTFTTRLLPKWVFSVEENLSSESLSEADMKRIGREVQTAVRRYSKAQ